MGFSRYCPSSLDLPNFVVRRCRGSAAAAEGAPAISGPSPAQARFLEIWNLEIWKFGIQKIPKIKIPKLKIHVAQNVGKVWISRKNPPGPIWGHLGPIFPWAGKIQKTRKVLPIFLGGPMGPIHPLWPIGRPSRISCKELLL